MTSLKSRFEEIIHMKWGEFLALEEDKNASVNDTILCTLVRTCADTDDISSIKLAFDRVEGLLETLIEVKVPKFYTRYVNAKSIEGGAPAEEETEVVEEEKDDSSKYDPATAKLRETLNEMRTLPRDVVRVVRLYKKRIEAGSEVETEPRVKAVIVANLLRQVNKGNFRAITLVFDQIDGKLPKAIQLLGGDDVYVDDLNAEVAPAHAKLDKDGIYYAEDKKMTAGWLRGFARSQKGLEMLAEGLDDI